MGGLRGVNGPYLAVVSVDGARYLNRVSEVGFAITRGVGGAFVCASVSVQECKDYYRDVRDNFTGNLTISGMGLEAAKEVFYVGIPGTLEVKGQVSSPTYTEVTPF